MNKELVLNKESKKENLGKKILTRGAFIIGYVVALNFIQASNVFAADEPGSAQALAGGHSGGGGQLQLSQGDGSGGLRRSGV